jgi:glycosyltransferase 2 family protein
VKLGKTARFLGATAVAGLAFWLAFRGVSLSELADVGREVRWGPVWGSLGVMVILILARLLRWGILVRQLQPVPAAKLFAIGNVGFMAIDLLPLRMGELVRPVLLTRNAGVPFGAGAATIVVERVLDLCAVGVCLLAALLLAEMPELMVTVFDQEVNLAVQGRNAILFALTVLGGPVLILGLAGPRGAAILARLLNLLPDKISKPAIYVVTTFVSAVRSMASPWVVACTVGLSAVPWGCNLIVLWLILKAFGVELGLAEANVVMLAVSIALMLPAPAGGLGVFEAGAVAGAMIYGVPQATASGFALALHASHLVVVVAFGLLSIGSLDIGLRHLWRLPSEAEIEPTEQAPGGATGPGGGPPPDHPTN